MSVTVSTTSVAVTPGWISPVSLKPDDARDQHGDRLAEHGGLGLDAADAPAQNAQPFSMVVCESVPTQVSG